MTSLLQTRGLTASYGDFQALYGVDFKIEEAQTVSIIGSNGAGKSTLLKSICGLLPRNAQSVFYDGQDISGLDAAKIASTRGIAMVPEGRRLFPSLSVEENLLIGQYATHTNGERKPTWTLESVFELFPLLKERRKQPSTSLSGGQQQMASIGRALMSAPRLLLCDEISLGLAPAVINDIYEALPAISQIGASIVLIEQDINRALSMADHVYCMQEGRITLSGAPSELTNDAIHQAYFGT